MEYSSEEVKEVSEGLKRTIKVLSLFSGAGLVDFPLHLDKNFKIVKAIELNKAACKTYKANIGDIILNEDIDLMGEYIRILKSHKFKAFVMENVPQVITANNGKYFNNLKDQLKDFDINYIVLQDSNCGGYTTRKRAFIFGSRIGKISLAYVKKIGKTVGDAFKKVTSKWFNFNDITVPSPETKERMSYVPQGGNWQDLPKSLWLPSYKVGKTHSNTYRRLALDRPSITLANYRKCNLIHPTENRGLSVAEASAISGFEDYKFLGNLSDRQMQIANGAPFFLGFTVKNIIKKLFTRYFYKEDNYIY